MALLTAPQPEPPSPRWLSRGKDEEDEKPQFRNNLGERRRNSPEIGAGNEDAGAVRPMKKRPARLVIPTCFPGLDFVDKVKKVDFVKEFEVIEGRDFFLVSKKGRREVMEDRHAAVVDISGDPKQVCDRLET